MGLRFRKSISLGSLFRLNLSKSGVSVGVGPKGLNVNVSPQGVRQTIGLPGTGLYYQRTNSWPKSGEADAFASSDAGSSAGGFWLVAGVVTVLIAIAIYVGSESDARSKSVVAVPAIAELPSQPTVTAFAPDRPLSRQEVRELQALLNGQGFNAGTPDGIVGSKTRTAMQAFIRTHRVNAQGAPSLRLLETARSYRK